MGSKPKTPPPPDYKAEAAAQGAQDRLLVQEQTKANRPDQYNPMGSLTWQQDPETGAWTQRETWSPELLSMYNKQLGIQDTQLNKAQELLNKPEFQAPSETLGYTPYGEPLPEYDQASGDAFANKYSEALLARIRPQQQQDQSAMESKLRMQGLVPGSEAYNRAYTNLLTSQGDVTAQAQLQGQLAGSQEARDVFDAQLRRHAAGAASHAQDFQFGSQAQRAQYNQALEQYMLPYQTAGMTPPVNVTQPAFAGFSGAGVSQAANTTGAASQNYAQQMQAYNDAVAARKANGQAAGSVIGGAIGTIFGPVGTAAGSAIGGAAGGALYSDPTLKDDLEAMSDEECYNLMLGLVPHSWQWTGTSVVDGGVSAAQVAEIMPKLVSKCNRGLMKVNYTGLFAILLGAFRHMAAKEKANANAPAT